MEVQGRADHQFFQINRSEDEEMENEVDQTTRTVDEEQQLNQNNIPVQNYEEQQDQQEPLLNQPDDQDEGVQRFYLVIIINAIQFALLSLSLHYELANDGFSDFMRHSYVLLGFSIAGLLGFFVVVWYISHEKTFLVWACILLSTLVQISFITFLQTLASNQEYKEISVVAAYYIFCGILIFGISFCFPKIQKTYFFLMMVVLYAVALGILIWKLKQYMLFYSALVSGCFVYVLFSYEEDSKSISYSEAILRAFKIWMLFIPFTAFFIVFILIKTYTF